MRTRHGRLRWQLALLSCVLAALASAIGWVSDVPGVVDRALLDRAAPVQGKRRANDVLLVVIDDKSMADLGQWPWSRGIHAQLIERLHAAGAHTIALDLLISEPSSADPEGDRLLAAAIARHGDVLLPVPRLDPTLARTAAPAMAALWPAAHFVHSDVAFDPDGMVRRIHRWADYGDASFPALPLALGTPELAVDADMLAAVARTPRAETWTPHDAVLVTDMAMPDTLPVYSYIDVLAGDVPADIFQGRDVVVGVTAAGFGQRYMTPRSGREKQSLAGVELNAVAADELSGGRNIVPASSLLQLWCAIALAVVIVATMYSVRPRYSLSVLLAGLLLSLLLPVLLVRHWNLWLGLASAWPGMLVGAGVWWWLRARILRDRERHFMQEAQRMASDLVEAVIALDRHGGIVHVSGEASGLVASVAEHRLERSTLEGVARTVPPLRELLAQHGDAADATVHHAVRVAADGTLEPLEIHIFPSSAYTRRGLVVTLARQKGGGGEGHRDIDPLTGLATRARLLAELERPALQSDAGGAQHTVFVLLALDGFKRINEALGVGEGDRVLVEVARHLAQLPLPLHMLARWGGDQFAALLHPGGIGADAQASARALHEAIDTLVIEPGHIKLSASVGAAQATRVGDGSEQLVQRAERALREVKRSGGGRWLVEGGDYAGWTRETLALEGELRQAVQARQFRMHYQPIMDLASGRFASMEALIRWERPGHGAVAPGTFLELAEEVGLDIQIGETAFALVQHDLLLLEAQGWSLPVSVNVSARHFERPDFVPIVTALPMATAGRLKVEVTESMALIDPERAAVQVLALEQAGVGVSLDDFGCGHSSLALLRSLRIRQVKIDRSFVQGADHDAGARALVKAIIGMAEALQLEVVAEGVETVAQSQWLQSLGCHLQQGYLFARPTPVETLPAVLGAHAAAPTPQ